MLTHKERLKDNIQAATKQLQARLATLKADVRAGAMDERTRVQQALGELESAAKSGWHTITEATAERINKLIERN